MQPQHYVPLPLELTGLTWPQASPADLAALVGAENVNPFPGGIQVRNSDGFWFTVHDGWLIAVDNSGRRHIISAAAIEVLYRRA